MNESLTKVSPNNSNSLPVQMDIEGFKSFYYLLKGKRDTDIKLYDENKYFSLDDFKELNEKIYAKLANHDIYTDMVNVTVGLDNKQIKSFGNWTEFINTDWQISNKVKWIVIDWVFQLLLPNRQNKIPQEHSLRVKIGNSLNPNELMSVLFLNGGDADIEEVKSQMSSKVDFVNAQICSELQNIVKKVLQSKLFGLCKLKVCASFAGADLNVCCKTQKDSISIWF